MAKHKTGELGGFTAKYGCKTLVLFETAPDMATAIKREKQLKRWYRDWKKNLIEQDNPQWRDLSEGWFDDAGWRSGLVASAGSSGSLGRPEDDV